MKPTSNTISAQPGLFTSIRWPRSCIPKREQILALLETSIPWPELEALVRPHYQADCRGTGRPGYSLRMMLRCYIIRMFWLMSDRQTEHAILDSHSLCKFIGSNPWQPRPPSATALRTFRSLLESVELDIAETLADRIEQLVITGLRTAGFEHRPGRIADPIFRKISP